MARDTAWRTLKASVEHDNDDNGVLCRTAMWTDLATANYMCRNASRGWFWLFFSRSFNNEKNSFAFIWVGRKMTDLRGGPRIYGAALGRERKFQMPQTLHNL